jgi:CO/xanthine dehydrogenase Mo-binding subunit
VAVFTGDDLAELGLAQHTNPAFPKGMRRPFVAAGTVRYVGQPVVAIVAEDRTCGADAAVDTETGHVRLRQIVAVDDAGRLLNPLLAEGQVHGGVAQALLYDEDGQPKTTNFADYPVISAAELSSFDIVHMETPTFANPLGDKGVGESGTIGAIPAVSNAVIDALGHLGVRHLETPLTPERVWHAVRTATSPGP